MTKVSKVWNDISKEYEQLISEYPTYVSRLKDYLENTVEHLILACLLYIIICILLYFCIIKWRILGFSRDMRNSKRIMFIIAHPDDEVMFFGPTILHYLRKKDCTVFLMCLTTGKNYGMGTIRTNELYNSCKVLGIDEQNIFVHTHTDLPDTMDVRWPTELVSRIILRASYALDITNIITFDKYGISYHPNHSSVYYSVALLILDNKLPRNCGVYVLESVNIVRKYWLLLDIPLSYIFSRFRYMEGCMGRKVIHSAMRQHKSQLVWYRKWYMYFSRYMMINTLQQMNYVDIELDLELED